MEGLAIPWLAYYDDFPVFALEDETSTVERAVDELFDVMGVNYARSGKKATSLSTEVSALGLIFCLTPREAEVLRRRLHWVNSYLPYLFGRGPCTAMQELSRRAQGGCVSSRLHSELRCALQRLLMHVEGASGNLLGEDLHPIHRWIL